jgi:hypothetical protein
MRIYYEVYQAGAGEDGREIAARVEATELSPEGQAEALAALRELYPGGGIYCHECRHEGSGACTMTEVSP